MADIALTAAQIAPVDCCQNEIYSFVAGGTITAGQSVSLTAAGLAVPADADGTPPLTQARGIALNGAGSGQAVSVLKKGLCAGFTVSGMAYGAKIYPSATVGALADAAVSSQIPCGQVVALPDSSATKIAYFEFNWTAGY